VKNRYIYLFLAAMLAFSCTKPEDILDDFQVRITPEFYSYIIQVNVEDLADPSAAIPSNLEIEITGPGADGIYYTDGTKSYKISNGVLQLFVKRENEPTEGNPVDFNVVLKSSGYRTNSTRVSVALDNYSIDATARLLNLSKLPTGVSNNTAVAAVDPATNALSQPLTFAAGSSDSTSSTEITIAAGTKFLDADGNVIVGKGGAADLNVSVISVSDTSASGQASYPGGTGLIQQLDNGGVAERHFFMTSPSFDISMDLAGVPVRGFDGGKMAGTISTVVNLPSIHKNPNTGLAYKVGDQVGVIAFDYDDDRWKSLPGTYPVYENPAKTKLLVLVNLTNPGPIKIYPDAASTQTVDLALDAYIVPINAVATPSKQGSITAVTSSGFRFLLNGPFETDPNSYMNQRILKIPLLGPTNLSTIFSLVSSVGLSGWSITPETRVTNLPTGADFAMSFRCAQINPGVTIGFTLQCDGAFIQPPAGTIMKYREHLPADLCPTGDVADFTKTLFTFTPQNINLTSNTFTELEDGKFYDFRAISSGESVDTCNVRIINNTIYNVVPPQGLCNKIGL
jgi:hypothetical protein